jgi:hypothetical protein
MKTVRKYSPPHYNTTPVLAKTQPFLFPAFLQKKTKDKELMFNTEYGGLQRKEQQKFSKIYRARVVLISANFLLPKRSLGCIWKCAQAQVFNCGNEKVAACSISV